MQAVHPPIHVHIATTCAGCDSSEVTICPIPVSDTLHVELGRERAVPDPSAPFPRPAVIVQVCPLTPQLLAVVGVASASQCLHSLTVVESNTQVLVRALVGTHPELKRCDDSGCGMCRDLWVAEVALDLPLDHRAIKVISPPLSRSGTVY